MSENVIQTSFASGELSPSIFARTDLSKYHAGAARMRNFFVDYRSGASTRPGLIFINQAFQSSSKVRLIPFQFSTTATYIIEFGDKYCRFYTNGASVLEASFAIGAINNANPMQVKAPGHDFVINDWVFIKSVSGMPQVNARYYKVLGTAGDLLTLGTVNGVLVNSSSYGIYAGGGTIARVYTIASPYAASDLALLKFVQLSNVMTLTHVAYAPQSLAALAPTNWNFTPISFATTIGSPTGLIFVASAAGGANYSYAVTAVDSSGQESAASTLAVNGVVNLSTTAGTIELTWNPVAGAVSYNVYKAEMSLVGGVPAGSAYGFIQSVTSVQVVDSNIVPDFAQSPPILANPFTGGNNPGCSCFFQQRAYYAGSTNFPTTFWASQPGIYNNFNTSDPVIDSDAITGTLVSLQVNAIKSMLPMPGGLIMLTAQGAWQVSGGGGGLATTTAVTPSNIVANPQAYNGASDVPPIVVNYDILYVQSKGTIVRDLSYNIYANIYTGADVSILSNHLFFGHQITEWAWAEEPFKIVWVVRDDGILLSLTYVKEQEMFGWARHDTLGLFESVATVREGQVDAIYVVVKRFLGGIWVQTIERLANRTFVYGAEDSFCVDCGLQSSLTYPAANLIADTSTGTVNFTADSAIFSAGNVGSILRMDGGIATITSLTSPSILQGTWTQEPTQTLPNDPNNTPIPATQGTWSLTPPSTVFYGLDHLEGQTVSILADGGVVAPQVVSGGKVTLPDAATKVSVGLKFTAQLQTMYLDVGEPTIQGKRKKINALTVRAVETRGLEAGRTFDLLTPIKELNPSVPLGSPVPLITGDQRIVMDPLWDVPGQICLQQENPLPSTVLGVIPEITIGDTR